MRRQNSWIKKRNLTNTDYKNEFAGSLLVRNFSQRKQEQDNELNVCYTYCIWINLFVILQTVKCISSYVVIQIYTLNVYLYHTLQ